MPSTLRRRGSRRGACRQKFHLNRRRVGCSPELVPRAQRVGMVSVKERVAGGVEEDLGKSIFIYVCLADFSRITILKPM